jgi:hypothetical protein
MIKTKPKRLVLLFRVTMLMVMTFVLAYLSFGQPVSKVSAAAASTVNFQSRLMNAAGATVPDGTYNVEFKLYDTCTVVASSGGCTTFSGNVWTETRTGSDKVRVVNGYLTVNLGSVHAFSGVNWDQELWMTMNIGGTGTPGWDGEMTPALKLTAVPFAFMAGGLANTTGANRSTLGWATQSAANSILLPNEGGTICIQSSVNCGFLTSGSAAGSFVQLQGSTPGTPQTGNLNVSGTGIAGTALQSPLIYGNTIDTVSGTTTLNIGTTNATSGINLNQNVTVASGKTVTIQGATTITTNSATALQVGNSGGNKILTVDTSANIVKIISGAMSDIASDGTSGGALQIGPTSTYNLLVDDNEIMARNGTGTDTLYLQKAGGGLRVQASAVLFKPQSDSTTAYQIQPHGSTVPALNVDTQNSRVGIGTDSPNTGLEVDKGLLNTAVNQNFNIFSVDTAAAAQNAGGGIGFGGNADSMRAFSAIQGFHESATAADYAGGLRFFTRPSGGDLAERVRISSSGNLGVNNTNPQYKIDVVGDVRVDSTGTFKVGNTTVCDSTGCITQSGANNFIKNQTTVQAANLFVQAAASNSVAAKFQSNAAGTGDIMDLLDGSNNVIASFGSAGAALFKSANSANAFAVQNSTGASYLTVDTSGASIKLGDGVTTTSIVVGDGTNNVTFAGSTREMTLNGNARHSRRVTLQPEFAGAVMTAQNGCTSCSGTMTSDAEPAAGVSPLSAAEGYGHSYYSWTTTQGTNQNYDIWVSYTIPSDFAALKNSSTPFSVWTKTSDTTNGTVTMQAFNSTRSNYCFGNASDTPASLTPSTTNTWEEKSTGAMDAACSFSADGRIWMRFRLQAPSGGTTKLGELRFDYYSKW